ncbi:MAG: hypothetical protein AAGD06_29605 [Acidobacteriota bacterium]
MPTELQWIDPTTSEPFAGAIPFTGVQNGTPSASVAVELRNVGTEPGNGLRLSAIGRRPAAQGQPPADFQESGLPVLDRRGLQLRLTGGVGGLPVDATAWKPFGAGVWVDLPDLPAGTGVAAELRAALPLGTGTDDVEVRLRIDDEASVPLARGVFESAGSGVVLGLGDGETTALFQTSGPITTSSPADAFIHLPDVGYLHRGQPYARLSESLELDSLDGDGVALAAGQGYAGAVTLGANGALTVTKGPAVALPITAEEWPAPPAGELLWLWAHRAFDGAIELADVEVAAVPAFFGLADVQGLTVRLGPGRAIVGDFLVRTAAEQQVDLPDDADSTVYLQSDATLAVTAGDPPEPRALPLWSSTALAGAVTGVQDRRRFLGRSVPVSLHIPNPTVGDVAVWSNPFDVPLVLPPAGAVTFHLHDDPATLGATTGAWVVDLEIRELGGSWTSLFVSQATQDRRPRIAYDGPEVSVDAWPEVLVLPARSLLRVRVVEIAADGAAVSGLGVSAAAQIREAS